MSLLKLKFKIEILHRILKFSNLDEINTLTKTPEARSKYKPSSAKQSVRNSKIMSNELEALPGYEQLITKIDNEEKEELVAYTKTLDFTTLTSIFAILQSKQLYSKIKTKIGIEVLKSVFKEIIKTKNEEYLIETANNPEYVTINDECELFFYFKDVLNITELDAMEIFDMFKFNEFFSFNEMHFVVLIYTSISSECGCLEDCVKLFIDDFFNFISGGEKNINSSKLKDPGRIMGFTEKILNSLSTELGIDMYTPVDQNLFKEFYTILANKYDTQVKSQNVSANSSQATSSTSVRMVKASKNSGYGCISKACNIL